MIKKEKFMLSISGFLSLVFSIKLVSAQVSPNQYMQTFIEWANSNFGPLFQALLGTPEIDSFLFAKILILILLFCIISMILARMALFEGRRSMISVVSLIVSLLAVRFLQENQLTTMILLPYGGMGAAITAFLPFVIFFMFVHTSIPGSFGRRAAWCLYAAFFICLWIMRYNDSTSGLASSASVNWIYPLAVIFIVLSILFDRTIHAFFQYGEYERARENIDMRARLQTLEDLDRARRLGNRRDVERLERRMRANSWPV